MSGMSQKRKAAARRGDLERQVRESYLTISRYLTIHRRCEDDELELQDGSILEDIRRRHPGLRKHQILAWMRLWNTLIAAHGSTNGMHGSYQEQVDSSGPGRAEDFMFASRAALAVTVAQSRPRIYLTREGEEFQALWDHLRQEERGLAEQLIRDYHRASGNRDVHAPTLPALGMLLSGYQEPRQQMAAGVTSVQRLLNSIAEFYGISVFLA